MRYRHSLMLLMAICLLGVSDVWADRYEITYLHNSKYIKIGNRKVRKGGQFDESEAISWKQCHFMRARNLKTGVEKAFSDKAFRKHGVSSVGEFVTKERTLYTRGTQTTAHYYKNVDHYLADSLHVEAFSEPQDDMAVECVWTTEKGQEVMTPLQRTADGRYYIITPAIFGSRTPRDVKITIRERSLDGSWTDNVYNDFPIVVISK